jgi:hypothetical protein
MSTPEDVAEQQRRLKPGVIVFQHLFPRVRESSKHLSIYLSAEKLIIV